MKYTVTNVDIIMMLRELLLSNLIFSFNSIIALEFSKTLQQNYTTSLFSLSLTSIKFNTPPPPKHGKRTHHSPGTAARTHYSPGTAAGFPAVAQQLRPIPSGVHPRPLSRHHHPRLGLRFLLRRQMPPVAFPPAGEELQPPKLRGKRRCGKRRRVESERRHGDGIGAQV